MRDEHQNVAALRSAYGRWADSKGVSIDQWMDLCSERLAFGTQAESIAELDYLTTYDSRDALRGYFEGLARDWEMVSFQIDHLVAQGDRVVALGRCAWRFRKTGKICETPKADSWRFENGKAVEYYEYYDTAAMKAAIA